MLTQWCLFFSFRTIVMYTVTLYIFQCYDLHTVSDEVVSFRNGTHTKFINVKIIYPFWESLISTFKGQAGWATVNMLDL
jgi:hypothetical protein